MTSVDSTRDSTAEAWHWLERELEGRPMPPVLVLVGGGDGRLLDALERNGAPTRVLAIEPDPANRQRFFANPKAETWRDSGRLVYLAHPDYIGADDAWRLFPSSGGKPVVVTHPELTRCEGVGRAKQVLKRILFGVEANAAARRRFAPRYLINSIRNVPAMMRGGNLKALTDKYRGIPAIIAGAGPSLDAAIEPLQRFGDRALLIAADTALRPLLTAGVAPQLVVGMDPGTANLRHFLGLPECGNTWLVAESALDPNAAVAFADRTFWFRLANHEPWPWLKSIGVDVGALEVWGSVLTGAFQVACLAGCDPIVVVGADLAYTGGQPYARGTTYEFDWAWYAGYGRALHITWDCHRTGARTHETMDLHGAPTETTEVLQSFRDWMVARARRSGRRIVNATGAGILFGDGIEHSALEQTLPERPEIAPVRAFARASPSSLRSTVASRFSRVRAALTRGERDTGPVSEWVEFSGGGFDAAALGAALDHTVTSLSVEQPEGRTTSSRWLEPVSAHMTGERMREMPEATLRLRAGLNGLPLPPAPACADTDARASTLSAALIELEGLCALLLDGEGEAAQPVVNLPEYGQVPVALMYAWSDEQRWAVQAFEALLGKAWAPDAPVAPADDTTPSDSPRARPPALEACRRLASQWLRCAQGAQGSLIAALRGADLDRLQRLKELLGIVDGAR